MDLNQLLHAHQIATMRASDAGNIAERQSQFDLISQYARQIRLLRKQGGSPQTDTPFVHGEMLQPHST